MKELLMCVVTSLVSSIVTVLIIFLKSAHGTLRIDHSDPNKDIYRLDLDDLDDLDVLSRKKQVILDIDHHANLSQK